MLKMLLTNIIWPNYKCQLFQLSRNLTGVAGFEPTNGGVKVRSLTTWRHPKIFIKKTINYQIKICYWARRDSNP